MVDPVNQGGQIGAGFAKHIAKMKRFLQETNASLKRWVPAFLLSEQWLIKSRVANLECQESCYI